LQFHMDAYDRCTKYVKKKILPIVLPSVVETETFSDHPRIHRALPTASFVFVFVARGSWGCDKLFSRFCHAEKFGKQGSDLHSAAVEGKFSLLLSRNLVNGRNT
jgi:hypothetical protein